MSVAGDDDAHSVGAREKTPFELALDNLRADPSFREAYGRYDQALEKLEMIKEINLRDKAYITLQKEKLASFMTQSQEQIGALYSSSRASVADVEAEMFRVFEGYEPGTEDPVPGHVAPASDVAGILQVRRKVGAANWAAYEAYRDAVAKKLSFMFAVTGKVFSNIVKRITLLRDRVAYQQLFGVGLPIPVRLKRLPIRKGVDARASLTRSAYQYCRTSQSFDEAAIGLRAVGLTVKVDGRSNANWIDIPSPDFRFDPAYPNSPTYFSIVYGSGTRHAVGGIVFRKYVFLFNTYSLVYGSNLESINNTFSAYKTTIFPDSFLTPSGPMYDVQASLEKDFKTVGECQELAILLPWYAMKTRVLQPIVDLPVDTSLAEVIRQAQAMYASLIPLTIARYNELRREANLLG